MKEKLIERLKMIDEAIVKKSQELQQANADLNLLNGCKQELTNVIGIMEQEEKIPANKEKGKKPA